MTNSLPNLLPAQSVGDTLEIIQSHINQYKKQVRQIDNLMINSFVSPKNNPIYHHYQQKLEASKLVLKELRIIEARIEGRPTQSEIWENLTRAERRLKIRQLQLG